MKFALATIIALPILLYSNSNSAQESDMSARLAELHRIRQVYRTRPVRVDGPLREENISDDEVREIEAEMNESFPGAIVNIGGVTSGCPCEDGASCDSQVWVVAHRANRSNGLMLSRIEDHWTIGPLQKWWRLRDRLASLRHAAMTSKTAEYSKIHREFQERENQLELAFPTCDPQV